MPVSFNAAVLLPCQAASGVPRRPRIVLAGLTAALCAMVVLGLPLLAVTVQMAPNADTTLFEPDLNNNLGAVDSLAVGGTAAGPLSRSLIKFDLAGKVPATARIVAARLVFEVVKIPTSGGRPSDFLLHRQLTGWNEGTKAGGPRGTPATAGEATWSSREHGGAKWGRAGGAASIDFAADPSASVRVAGFGRYEFPSTTSLVADVQDWLAHPERNFGWMMLSRSERTAETARRIGAREAGEKAPQLFVEFTDESPAPVLRIDRFEVLSGQFFLHFQANSNHAYQVESREAAEAGAWVPVVQLPAAPRATNVIASGNLDGARRFYRLREHAAPLAR